MTEDRLDLETGDKLRIIMLCDRRTMARWMCARVSKDMQPNTPKQKPVHKGEAHYLQYHNGVGVV